MFKSFQRGLVKTLATLSALLLLNSCGDAFSWRSAFEELCREEEKKQLTAPISVEGYMVWNLFVPFEELILGKYEFIEEDQNFQLPEKGAEKFTYEYFRYSVVDRGSEACDELEYSRGGGGVFGKIPADRCMVRQLVDKPISKYKAELHTENHKFRGLDDYPYTIDKITISINMPHSFPGQ